MALPKQIYVSLFGLAFLLVIFYALDLALNTDEQDALQIYLESIPELPPLDNLPEEFRDALDQAHEQLNNDDTRLTGFITLGRLYQANGFSSHAIQVFQALRKLQPDKAQWAYNLGLLTEDYQDRSIPIGYFEKAKELYPDYRTTYLRLAILELKSLDPKAAQQHINSILDAESHAEEIGEVVRVEIEKQQQPDWSEEDYHVDLERLGAYPVGYDEWYLQLADYCFDSFRLRAFAAYELEFGKKERSGTILGRALEFDSEDVDTNFMMGETQVSLGDVPSSVLYFRKAIDLEPSDLRGYLALSDSYKSLGNHAEALPILNDGLDWVAEQVDLVARIAMIHEEIGEVEEAISQYRKAVALDPKHSASLLGLGRLLLSSGDDEGIRSLDRYLKRNPESFEANRLLAEYYQESRDWKKALPYLEAAYKSGSLDARFQLGKAYRKIGYNFASDGDVGNAVALLEKALALQAGDSQLLTVLGGLLEHAGRIDDAIRNYESLVKLEPEYSHVYYKLGKLYLEKGSKESAVNSLRKGRIIAYRNQSFKEISMFDELLDLLK